MKSIWFFALIMNAACLVLDIASHTAAWVILLSAAATISCGYVLTRDGS